MRDLLATLLLLSFIKFVLDEARQHRLSVRVVHGFFYVVAIITAHYRAQFLSLQQVETFINDVTTLQNIALVVMLDLLITLYITTSKKGSFTSRLRSLFVEKIPLATSDESALPPTPSSLVDRMKIALRITSLYLPSLLFIPGLFYLRLLLFYLFAGSSFTLVTLLLVIGILLLVILAPYILRFLMGEYNNYDTLCRSSIFCSFTLFIIVIIAGVLHPTSQVHHSSSSVLNIFELLVLAITVVIGGTIGYIISRFKKL